jgi:hypothetical protein
LSAATAVGFHAQPRATKDLDIFIKPDEQNAKAVYDALATFGAPLQDLTPHDLLDPDGFFRMGHAPVMIDILPKIDGVKFDEAWQRRVEILVDAQTGLTAFMLSREDLLAAKLAAGRPQDLADVDGNPQGGTSTNAKGDPRPWPNYQTNPTSR